MKSLPSPPSCFGPICWRTHSQKSSLSLTADSATAVETCSRRTCCQEGAAVVERARARRGRRGRADTSCSSERMSAMKGCRSVSSEKPRLVSRHTERERARAAAARDRSAARAAAEGTRPYRRRRGGPTARHPAAHRQAGDGERTTPRPLGEGEWRAAAARLSLEVRADHGCEHEVVHLGRGRGPASRRGREDRARGTSRGRSLVKVGARHGEGGSASRQRRRGL